MRRICSLFLCLFSLPGAALAHAGHLGELVGHDHLLAGVAIGIAIAIGLAGALKGRDDADADDEIRDDPEPEPSEA